MKFKDTIGVFPNAFTLKECNEIKNLFDKKIDLKEAVAGYSSSGQDNKMKKSTDYNLYNENSIDTIENIINHKVINYDFKNKEFNIFSEDNSVESLTKNIRENFLNKKTDIVREESPSVKNNKIFRSMYSTTSDLNTARFEGRNNLLKNLTKLM